MIYFRIEKAKKDDIKDVARVYVDGWRTSYQGLVSDGYLESLSYEEAEQKWIHFLNNANEAVIYIALNDYRFRCRKK